MSWSFLSCSMGVKDPLEVPEFRCDLPRDASAEMGLISPGGENLLDFLQLRQVLSTYDGDRRNPLWWTEERPVKIQDSPGEGETSQEAPEQLAWGLAFLEATRAGP